MACSCKYPACLAFDSLLNFHLQAIDVGQALAVIAEDDNTASKTYELYGPTKYSMAEIAQLVDREILKHRRRLNIPKRLLKPVANLLNSLIWWRTTSADEVEREFIDQEIDRSAKTFKDLGIEPGELSNFTFHYLVGGYILESNRTMTDRNLLSTAIISKLVFLRSTSGHGAREKRRKEVSACH